METINRALLSYGVNALWQIPLVALMAAPAARFLRHASARYIHAIWCAALITALVAPAAGIRKFDISQAVCGIYPHRQDHGEKRSR